MVIKKKASKLYKLWVLQVIFLWLKFVGIVWWTITSLEFHHI